ncbi:hypothetical protein F3Y22_tig00110833pilonHSYRG00140 [Hibiscus syriacus]|uniref:Uncharacterized protein n=1 Tax=Hibiscus syriacus TaxID=106335 RepID=A0A6A2ZKA6_HIBSY|nr:hypothetical protein F3Y22_tig00110833pilonHSYRG00140 [Hibiscus syriacus]
MGSDYPLKAVTLTHRASRNVLWVRPRNIPIINELIKKSVQQARPETCAQLEMCDSQAGLRVTLNTCSSSPFTYLLTCKGSGLSGLPYLAQAFAGAALGAFSWDTSHIQDVLKFEYDNARAARTSMAARKAMASRGVECSKSRNS